jgi:CRP/FNR family transcriptional regulator, cyclic AMP receptor protein
MEKGETKRSSYWANVFKPKTEKSDLEEVLLSTPPFKHLTSKHLNALIKMMHDRLYQSNECIFHQDDPGTGLYTIVRGEVLITQEEENDRWDLALLGRGDFFGELALLDDERRSASAIALKETQIAVIFKPDLDKFVETYPREGIKILNGMAQIVATRLRNLNQDYFALYNKSRNQ